MAVGKTALLFICSTTGGVTGKRSCPQPMNRHCPVLICVDYKNHKKSVAHRQSA
jgi:hypothetical protein